MYCKPLGWDGKFWDLALVVSYCKVAWVSGQPWLDFPILPMCLSAFPAHLLSVCMLNHGIHNTSQRQTDFIAR